MAIETGHAALLEGKIELAISSDSYEYAGNFNYPIYLQ